MTRTPATLPWLMLTGELVSLGAALACSGERYARPSGPAPSYETAPVMAWDAGAAPEGESAGADSSETPGARVRETRLGARSTIYLADLGAARGAASQERAQSAHDERHQIENVTND